MTRSLGTALPDELRAVLRRDDAEGQTFLLLTADGEGWPRMAMLSVGEVACAADGRLGLALWPGSSGARNLTASGRGVLAAVVGGTSYTVRIAAERLADLTRPSRRACFAARVVDVGADTAPYAVLEEGVRFRLTDPAATLPLWKQTRAALLDALDAPAAPAEGGSP